MVMSLLLVSGTTAVSGTQRSAGSSRTVQQPSSFHQEPDKVSALRAMIGKRVLGKSREFLGNLISVDEAKKMAQMKIPMGAVVPFSTDVLSIEDDHVRAATVSRGDVLLLVRKTGQAGTLEAGVLPNPFK
jgi:hypothetical protein